MSSAAGGAVTGSIAGSTDTTWPVRTRSLPMCCTSPSMAAPPAATNAAASLRLQSVISDTMIEPLTAEGRGDLFLDHAGFSCLLNSDQSTNSAPPMLTPMSATLKMGNHWKSMKSTTEPCSHVTAEQSVEQVADGAAHHEAGSDGHQRVLVLAYAEHHHDDHHQGNESDDGPDALPGRERHTAVEGQVPLQRPHDVLRRFAGESVHRPVLAELVDGDHGERNRHRESQPVSRPDVVGHRRPIPPIFSSTSTVAHGMASSRSRGMGRPDSTE